MSSNDNATIAALASYLVQANQIREILAKEHQYAESAPGWSHIYIYIFFLFQFIRILPFMFLYVSVDYSLVVLKV